MKKIFYYVNILIASFKKGGEKMGDSLTAKERARVSRALSKLGTKGSISFSGKDEFRREIERLSRKLSEATGIRPGKIVPYILGLHILGLPLRSIGT